MTGNTQTTGTTNTNHTTILNRIGDYAKTNFVINWASGVIIVGAIAACIFLYEENKGLKKNINNQNTTITELKSLVKSQGETINTINITFETMKSTVEAFRANPPSMYDEKINGIYRIISIYHNNNGGNTNHNPPSFHNVTPNINNTITTDTTTNGNN
jgi:hypothetical protein